MGRPEIFNTDQGAQFTSEDFTGRLEANGITISMDARGRAMDNIFVERLWRSVKYEAVHLHGYEQVSEAVRNLGNHFLFYNQERLHQALGYQTPAAGCNGGGKGPGRCGIKFYPGLSKLAARRPFGRIKPFDFSQHSASPQDQVPVVATGCPN